MSVPVVESAAGRGYATEFVTRTRASASVFLGRSSCLGLAALALGLAGCPKNVPQELHTSKDGRPKGARKITLDDDGEGRSKRDIVTYPGGDRVDWKSFEVPAGKFGSLRIKLAWEPPRSGLDLAFNVFDPYYARIAQAKPTPDSGRRTKRVTIENVEGGKYFIQVYAPRRGDAGTYRVEVRFTEALRPPDKTASVRQIPDPPTLPALPEPGDPSATPTASGGGGGGGTPAANPTPTATEPPEVKPVAARIVKYQVSSSGSLVVTVDKGKNAGVENGWKGQVLAGSGKPLEGGQFTITKVTGAESLGKISLSVDQIKSNRKVLLTPQ